MRRLRTLLLGDPARMAALDAVRSLSLPDCWIGAGFVRNAVWDRLHDRPAAIETDIDVIWFDPARTDPDEDRALTAMLVGHRPDLDWSVRNQARMHRRNGDAPYRSATDAMRFWPETATAVAVRLGADGGLDIAAPFGLTDLWSLLLRPTPAFSADRLAGFEARLRDRSWLSRWPLLRLASADVI